MYDETRRHYDHAAAKGEAVLELIWLGRHTDADTEGRAFFHREYDPYARRGLGHSDECVRDVESWYAFLWAELDCRTTGRATNSYREEAARHGIILPAGEKGIRTLADRHDVWSTIRG